MENGVAALFQPGNIGTLELKNRIVMAAVATKLATNTGGVSEAYREFLRERAAGGAALLISENMCVDWPRGKGGSTLLRIDQEESIPGLHALVEDVHRSGASIVAQLQHVGRQTSLRYTQGLVPLGPSSRLRGVGSDVDPSSLDKAGFDKVIEMFAQAARRARAAGFDGVEIHGAHGYLITQVMSPAMNDRSDAYGGNLAQRLTFVRQLISAVRQSTGVDYPIIFRYSADEHLANGIGLEEAIQIARTVVDAGVDALHVSAGTYETKEWIFPPMSIAEGYNVDLAARIRQHVDKPVIVVGKLGDPTRAARVVEEGKADFIALGRPLIADPNWPNKVASGHVRTVRPCLSCNECIRHVARQWPIRCAVNPRAGRESAIRRLNRSTGVTPLDVLVVGAGPAGLEAACSLASSGNHVTLVEKGASLGGRLQLAATPPGKGGLGRLVAYYTSELDRLGVKVHLETEATPEAIADPRWDAVVVATGARRAADGIEVIESATVWLEDILSGKASVSGDVVVIGGGRAGCEVAHFIIADGGIAGERVTVLDMLGEFAEDAEPISRGLLLATLTRQGVRFLPNARAKRVCGTEIEYEDVTTGRPQVVHGDSVIMATGWRPDRRLYEEVKATGAPVHLIGDALRISDIFHAVHTGADIAARICDGSSY